METLYRKIEIKTEADLPPIKSVDDTYLVCLKNGSLDQYFLCNEITAEEWMNNVDWYLLPIEQEPQKSPEEILNECNTSDIHYDVNGDNRIDILGLKNAWPLKDVLKKLIEASEILLLKKDYDGHGWEEISHCVTRGKEILAMIEGIKKITKKEQQKWANKEMVKWATELDEKRLKQEENKCDHVPKAYPMPIIDKIGVACAKCGLDMNHIKQEGEKGMTPKYDYLKIRKAGKGCLKGISCNLCEVNDKTNFAKCLYNSEFASDDELEKLGLIDG